MVARVENQLKNDLRQALQEVVDTENIQVAELPEIELEIPREKAHGDYATNLAMVMAGQFQRSPREIAEFIVEKFSSQIVEDIDIAGPGFINFVLNKDWLYDCLKLINNKGKDYGRIDIGKSNKVQIEFVSANPTGPLHVGHSRGAVVGGVLARIMETAGFDVDTEYYINDAGNQIKVLAESTLIRYKQECGQDVKLPENSYAGDYLKTIARQIREEYGDGILSKSRSRQLEICQEFAYQKMLDQIKKDLRDFGIEFDCWFSESVLHEEGKIEKAINILEDKGYIYEEGGALWFKATVFGDDKDRVIVKSDGEYTYLAADIAYHLNKIERGYDKLINIWGADHHGYISRVKAAIEAFGNQREMLEVIIVQMVTLLREGKKVTMSKRAGDFVTMSDVLEEVGRDAARYFYIMRSSDSHFDFDLDLAKEQSTKNPVYYIQYAHARIHSVLENAETDITGEKDLSLLNSEEEVELMKLLARYPEEIKLSAETRQPHHLASYAYDLANAFHIFYNKCRVITEDQELSQARLYLVRASRQVLLNILSLLGISAPKQM